MVLILPLGMVNEDDYAADLLLSAFEYSVEERLFLRITLRGNNSVCERRCFARRFCRFGEIKSIGGLTFVAGEINYVGD